MKILLFILIILLAWLILLLLVPIRIVCTADTTHNVDFSVSLRVLFLKIPIFPRKKRLPNLKRFRMEALEKRYRKKQKQAERKAKKKAQKKQKSEARKKARAKKTGVMPKKRGFRHTLRLISALARVLLSRFGTYLTVDIAYFDIIAAAENPADAAVMYGWAYALMENLWAMLSGTRAFRRVRKNAVSIYADFTRQQPAVRARIAFSIALWQAAVILICSGGAALAVENEARRNESEEEKAARREAEARARAEVIKELKK